MLETVETLVEELTQIVGKDWVGSSQEKIAPYSQDQSLNEKCAPFCVVLPATEAEVVSIIQLADEHRIPLVPRSSKVGLHGASIPTQGGIVVDLQRLNRIIEINERNRYAIIEPGVSFLQLSKEARKHGFRVASPLLNPPSASVLSTYMERNQVTTAADFTFGVEHIISYTVIVPGGEQFTVGHPPLENTPASAPDGPGLNFYRIFQGAEGTLGIVTKMIIRLLPMPKAQKLFYFKTKTAAEAVKIIRCVQKSELGLECFALNNFNLASLLLQEPNDITEALQNGDYIGPRGATPWDSALQEEFSRLRKSLPQWVVVVNLSAIGPLPGEKIAYQELDLGDLVSSLGHRPVTSIEGATDLDSILRDEFVLPWRMQKRFGFRGSCQQVLFPSAPDQVDKWQDIVVDTAKDHNYSPDDIGICLLPVERARAFYCYFDFHCAPTNPKDTGQTKRFIRQLSHNLADAGVFFDRPYGGWAELMYSRVGVYTDYLKKIKRELDPNNIMNPGKLCF